MTKPHHHYCTYTDVHEEHAWHWWNCNAPVHEGHSENTYGMKCILHKGEFIPKKEEKKALQLPLSFGSYPSER